MSPVDVNGITKWAAEQFHLLYHDVYGLRSTSLRLTNVYGPRQRLRDDFQGFLPIFVRLAHRGRDDHGVRRRRAGARLPLRRRRRRVPAARRAATDDAAGEFFNIGNDERLSLREIADAVVRRRRVGSGRARPVARRPRRHRHRLVLRRLVEGEAHPRVGTAHRRSPTASRRRSRSTSSTVRGTCDRRRTVKERRPSSTSRGGWRRSSPSSARPIDRVVRSGVVPARSRDRARSRPSSPAFSGRRHAVAVASGTEALRLVAGWRSGSVPATR